MRELACSNPDLRELISAYRFELLEESEATELERHVATCQVCADEFYNMVELSGGINQHSQELLQVISRIKTERERKPTRWLIGLFKEPWVLHLAGYTAAFLIVVTALVYVQRWAWNTPNDSSSNTRGQFELFKPGSHVVSAPSLLEWEVVFGATVYQVEVSDAQTGDLLFQEECSKSSLRLSTGIRAKFRSGSTYRWQVKALDSTGRAIATSQSEFTVLQPPKF